MCIYYVDLPNLTYEKREHIFPAGLGGKLIAVICLYGAFLHTFEFADWNASLDTYEFPGFLGLICDWKRGQEYTMNEWINTLAKEMAEEY